MPLAESERTRQKERVPRHVAAAAHVLGIYSDWSGTVSYYASCMGLK